MIKSKTFVCYELNPVLCLTACKSNLADEKEERGGGYCLEQI